MLARPTLPRFVGAVALALVVLAVGAPIAAADDWWAYTEPANTAVVRPDDRPGPRGPGVAVDTRPLVIVEQPGFDWTDAGIGAGIAFGVALLGAAATVRLRRHGRVAPS